MDFFKENYKLTLEQDDEEINIHLYNIESNSGPLIHLKLKSLDKIDTEWDDKDIIRDIPRHLFKKGDYFQSSVSKFDKTDEYKNVSLLSIIHDILIENNSDLIYLKRLFSSSLKNYEEQVFMTEDAKDFWYLQMNKKPSIPVSYFKTDRRFVIIINE